MKIKIITGFRKDQAYSIPMEEAHKAYYLFFNPDARTVFADGLALKGSDIDRIEPDYQGSMDWNPNHILDQDDLNEIHKLGIDSKLRLVMNRASSVAKIASEEMLNLPLSSVLEMHPELATSSERREGTMKRIGELTPKLEGEDRRLTNGK